MPVYSGNLVNTTLAQNYRRTAPSSNFGTRKLAWYTVWVEQDHGLAENYAENNSLFYQMVRAIQQGSFIGGVGDGSNTEGNGDIRGGGGGGAELFYVGTPQNSATSTLNQQSNWYGFKPVYPTNHISVIKAEPTASVGIARLTFGSNQGTAPFNVGDPVQVVNVDATYNCNLSDQHFVTACTPTYVEFNSTTAASTFDDLSGAYVFADLGADCFTFAVVDDAEPFLPRGSGNFGDTDYMGIAGDGECYCCDGSFGGTIVPANFWFAIYQVLVDNQLNSTNFDIYRLKSNIGLTSL